MNVGHDPNLKARAIGEDREQHGPDRDSSIQRLKHGVRGILPVLRRIRSVSFSFYAEDVLLSHMRPQAKGVYVDVGAFHPQMLSNTYKLYLKGWTGITIEPNPDAAAGFRSARPRDKHLTNGVAERDSSLTYHKFRDATQNTFDTTRAAELQIEKLGEILVECMPLNDVFEQFCRDRHVDLLNVDCEGRDLEVIQSLDWRRHRPTVLIVEDFEQFHTGASSAPHSSKIRSFMIKQDYAIASQAAFSFFYVDRRAFARTDRKSGFRLDLSQFGYLASSTSTCSNSPSPAGKEGIDGSPRRAGDGGEGIP